MDLADVEAAALADPASLFSEPAMGWARTHRRRHPVEFAALCVRLRRTHGMAGHVDRWERLLSRTVGEPSALDCDSMGQPRPTLRNAVDALSAALERPEDHAHDDPAPPASIRLDTFGARVMVDGEALSDVRDSLTAIWLDRRHAIRVSSALAGEATRTIAARHAYHPVRDYLRGLEWDGNPRAETWLPRLLGVEDSELHRAYSLAFLISCVARVHDPGCKVDTVLLLLGQQGAKKSSALRALVGSAWFADTAIDIHDKDARQALPGVWVYEWGELDAVKRSEQSAVKAFLSTQVDHFRPSYGRYMVDVPRQTVFVGSSNEPEPLSDPTGSRRFWPVTVGPIDLVSIADERDQLWAEAAHAYTHGAHWWLDSDREIERAEAAHSHTTQDPWTVAVVEYVRLYGPCTSSEVLEKALGRPVAAQQRSDTSRVAAILSAAKATHTRARRGGTRAWVWSL
jgi:putative DNA primase/helicase